MNDWHRRADVSVTQHAAERYLERVAVRGDEGAKSLEAIFRASRPVGRDEPLPFRRQDRLHYYWHEETETYTVCEVLWRGRTWRDAVFKLVTVLVKGGGR